MPKERRHSALRKMSEKPYLLCQNRNRTPMLRHNLVQLLAEMPGAGDTAQH